MTPGGLGSVAVCVVLAYVVRVFLAPLLLSPLTMSEPRPDPRLRGGIRVPHVRILDAKVFDSDEACLTEAVALRSPVLIRNLRTVASWPALSRWAPLRRESEYGGGYVACKSSLLGLGFFVVLFFCFFFPCEIGAGAHFLKKKKKKKCLSSNWK
jgi:hypothetical protein